MHDIEVCTQNNGSVEVSFKWYCQYDNVFKKDSRYYVSRGNYVHEVIDRAEFQICEGLRHTGPTLMLSGSLEDTIKRTLNIK